MEGDCFSCVAYVTILWGLGVKTPKADFLFQRVILTITYGATHIGDLVQAASALANPQFETQIDYLARTKGPRQWGFNGRRGD